MTRGLVATLLLEWSGASVRNRPSVLGVGGLDDFCAAASDLGEL